MHYTVGHLTLTLTKATIKRKYYDKITLKYPINRPTCEHVKVLSDRMTSLVNKGMLHTYQEIIPGLTAAENINISFDTQVELR